MFYAHFVLSKKGPLARIWLAAHWDKKLTKAQVFETNIEKSVEGILQPKVKLALRTSGHLLLGIVRIYSRKTKYLLADCNEAFVKIKMAFRPGMVDLPEENREAAVHAITLPEVFHDFDAAMPDLNDMDIQAQFDQNQTHSEEITMREDYGNLSLMNHDDGFGEMVAFTGETPDLMRDHSVEQQGNLDYGETSSLLANKEVEASIDLPAQQSSLELNHSIRDDGFGPIEQDGLGEGLFDGGLFDDAPMAEETQPVAPPPVEEDRPPSPLSDNDDFGDFGGPPSIGGGSSSEGSRATSPSPEDKVEEAPLELQREDLPPLDTRVGDQTTLLHNEEESFALAPVDASALKGWPRAKRKRKLIVDEVKNISGEEMKAQLSDTTDIVTTLDLAPPTKRLMHWKETGGVERLFALPGRPILARQPAKMYTRHLTSRCVADEEYDEDGNLIITDKEPELQPEEEKPRKGRKRKQAFEDYQEERADFNNLLAEHRASLHQGDDVIPTMPEQVLNRTPFVDRTADMPSVEELLASMHRRQQQMEAQQRELRNQRLDNGVPEPETVQQQPEESGKDVAAAPEPTLPTEATPVVDTATVPEPAAVPDATAVADISAPKDAATVPETTTVPETPAVSDPAANANATVVADPVSVVEGTTAIAETTSTVETVTQPPADAQPNPEMENMGYQQEQPELESAGLDKPQTPWNDDHYDFPPSVAPAEEQLADETYEQFEERVLNKRAIAMHRVIRTYLDETEKFSLNDMLQRNNRKQVSQKFYTLLVLKKHEAVEVSQESSYSPILIEKGTKFETCQL